MKGENRQKPNLRWPEFLGYPYTILIVGGSGLGKTNILLNPIHHDDNDILDKICFYVKGPKKLKYQFANQQIVGLKNLKTQY